MNFSYKLIFAVFLFFVISCDKKVKNEKKTLNKEIKEIKKEIVKKDSVIYAEKIIIDTVSQVEIIKTVKLYDNFDFTKGIYFNAYTCMSNKFDKYLLTAHKCGFNTVVFDIKNIKGTVYIKNLNKNNIFYENLDNSIPVKKIIEKIHKYKMKSVARLVMFKDEKIADKRDDLRIKSKNDTLLWQEMSGGKAKWLDPSIDKTQKSLLNLIETVSSLGCDEIQLDYIRFPTQGNLSDAIFNYQIEDSLRYAKDSLYVKRKKTDIIYNFVKKAKKICDKNYVNLTADIFAIVAWNGKVDIENTGQNIKKMSNYLNALHPMIYTSHFSEGFSYRNKIYNEPYFVLFEGTFRSMELVNKNCEVIPYIQANSWKVNYKKEYIFTQIDAIKDADGDGFILWSAGNSYDLIFKWMKEYNYLKK